MLVRGVGLLGHRAQAHEVRQRRQLALLDLVLHHGVELCGPVICLVGGGSTAGGAQVVHDVPAAHNQHTPLAQALKLLAQRIVLGRRAAVVHAQLQHR